MRVILINPFDETVKEAVYGGDFREIYDLIECRTFDCVGITSSTDLYVDDEGLLKDNQRYFRLLGTGIYNPFAGKGLLCSHNDEGETTGTNWELERVKNMVEFLPEGHRETPYMEFKAWQ